MFLSCIAAVLPYLSLLINRPFETLWKEKYKVSSIHRQCIQIDVCWTFIFIDLHYRFVQYSCNEKKIVFLWSKETCSFNTGSFNTNILLTMKNFTRMFTNADGVFVPSRYIRGIIVYGVNLVYPAVPAANYPWSFFDRAVIAVQYTPRKPLWFETERLARCIHSAVSSRAMCNDVSFTDRRGRGGITITCRKLFTNTRAKPKAHMHGEEGVGRDRARWEDGYRGLQCTGNDSGWW